MTQPSWGSDASLGSDASWDGDAGLLDDLRLALEEAGQVPPEFGVAARGSLAWRTVDDDLALAELTFDSVSDLSVPTRAATSDVRILAFGGAGVSIDVEVAGDGVTGQLSPAGTCRISGQTAAGTFDETDVDAIGCFVLRPPPPGPVRLRLSYPDGRGVVTTWVSVR